MGWCGVVHIKLYTQDPILESSNILNRLAEELTSERLPLHKAACRLREIYKGQHSQGFYEGHAAEARRRAVEKRCNTELDVVRRTAYAEPPLDWRNGNEPKLIVPQYLGGDNISIVGPLRLNIQVVGPDGSEIDKYNVDTMIPLRPCRSGIVEGISYGIRMVNALANYGESSRIKTKVESISRTTRSPTIKFYSEEDLSRAVGMLSDEGFKRRVFDIGEELMKPCCGKLGHITFNTGLVNSHHELSINLIYHMMGDFMGHEEGTYAAEKIIREVILPKLTLEGFGHRRLWLAGGEDLDQKQSKSNIRGRYVVAEVFLPREYLENEFADKKTGKRGITPEEFEELNATKHWNWPDKCGAVGHTGMEPEVLSSIYSGINPPSPPIVSSIIDVVAKAHKEPKEGVIYKVILRNLEWGIEGIRTPVRTELESTMGIDGRTPDPGGRNSIRAAGIIAAACLPPGINQHRLAYMEKLADTKKYI